MVEGFSDKFGYVDSAQVGTLRGFPNAQRRHFVDSNDGMIGYNGVYVGSRLPLVSLPSLIP